MTVTLDIPPAMAARLQEKADENEQPLEEYIYQLVTQARPNPRNGAEQFALLQDLGVIGM